MKCIFCKKMTKHETTKEIIAKVQPQIDKLEAKYKDDKLRISIGSLVYFGSFGVEKKEFEKQRGKISENERRKVPEIWPQIFVVWRVSYGGVNYGDWVTLRGAFSDTFNLEYVNVPYDRIDSFLIAQVLESVGDDLPAYMANFEKEVKNDQNKTLPNQQRSKNRLG